MANLSRSAVCVAGLMALGACSFLPSTGPSAGALEQEAKFASQVSLVNVSPASAHVIAASYQQAERTITQSTISKLNTGLRPVPVRMLPGDTVDVTLWTQPMLAGLSGNSNSRSSIVEKTDFGNFTVDDRGNLILPYAGRVSVMHLTIMQAEQRIAARFSKLEQFEQTQISLRITKNRRQHVIVTGAANHPLVVDWHTGGLSLSDAITEAGGYKIFQSTRGHDLATNRVLIQRGDRQFELPMKAALEADVQLNPGDVIVLQHETQVRVQCLGGGWMKDTMQSFDYTPSLAEVVASGGGLGTETAQGEAVYVLSQRQNTIYRFSWDTLAGLRASQAFPVQDGDIVYIATSPSVRFKQVANILFTAAYPIATANAVK